jgi:hypothetical protein
MKIRIVSRAGAHTEGEIVRVTMTRVQIKAHDKLLHTVNRNNGSPCGPRASFKVHPDDVHLLAGLALMAPVGRDHRRCVGVAGHWDV